MKVRFRFDRSTPGTHLYKEVTEGTNMPKAQKDCYIGSLYLRKVHPVFNTGQVPIYLDVEVIASPNQG